MGEFFALFFLFFALGLVIQFFFFGLLFFLVFIQNLGFIFLIFKEILIFPKKSKIFDLIEKKLT